MLPYAGIKEYWQIAADFARQYDPNFKLRLSDRVENTSVYFAAGGLLVVLGKIYPYLLVPLFELALVFYLLAAAREADAMHRFGWKLLNWQAWPGIPDQVVKSDGRKVVALGMYHATIFFLTGFALALTLLFGIL